MPCFAGVDVADDGTTRRWRVENSWGAKIADKGYFTMSDDWFTEYVYEVAVPKACCPRNTRRPSKSQPLCSRMGSDGRFGLTSSASRNRPDGQCCVFSQPVGC